MDAKRYVSEGDHFIARMPHSEVCMHMHVAGRQMECELTNGWSVQLYESGKPFSFPITRSEAGVLTDETNGLMYVMGG